jgi:hypothetical protein
MPNPINTAMHANIRKLLNKLTNPEGTRSILMTSAERVKAVIDTIDDSDDDDGDGGDNDNTNTDTYTDDVLDIDVNDSLDTLRRYKGIIESMNCTRKELVDVLGEYDGCVNGVNGSNGINCEGDVNDKNDEVGKGKYWLQCCVNACKIMEDGVELEGGVLKRRRIGE